MKRDADNLIPAGEKWAFDADVCEVFDAMLENSIPGYQDMRGLVTDVSRRFVSPAARVVDMGASRGDAIAPLLAYEPHARYVAVELSEPMRRVMQERFRGQPVEILDHDLRAEHGVFDAPADLVLSVLTLMFIPIEHRYRLLESVWRALRPGGGFVMVEKLLGDDPAMDGLLNELYYDFKARNGYTLEAITRKRLSLEGVLVPVTFDWNRQLLASSGFRRIQCFWRSLNFCAFLAVK